MKNSERTRPTKDNLAIRFGWIDYSHMISKEDEIKLCNKVVINKIFVENGFDKPFD